MRRQRSAKIVATLGPASSTAEQHRARCSTPGSMSSGSISATARTTITARASTPSARSRSETGRPIGILADLQGPKLRLGTFTDGKIELAAGDAFPPRPRPDARRRRARAPLPHPEIFAALEPGTELLLDDGKVRLKVDELRRAISPRPTCSSAATLSDRKGVNVPNAVLPLSALTPKDRADLAFALELGVDWVALSFVQRPEDVAEGRKLVGRPRRHAWSSSRSRRRSAASTRSSSSPTR